MPPAGGVQAEAHAGGACTSGAVELVPSPGGEREPMGAAAHRDAPAESRMDDEAPLERAEQPEDDAMDVQEPAAPPSPMRRATKRAAPTAENDLPPPRKRGRTEPAPALAAKRSVRVLRSSRLKNTAGARARGRPPSTGAGSHLTASRVAGASSSVAAGKSGDSEVAHDAAAQRQIPPEGSSSSKPLAQSEGARHGGRPIADRLVSEFVIFPLRSLGCLAAFAHAPARSDVGHGTTSQCVFYVR